MHAFIIRIGCFWGVGVIRVYVYIYIYTYIYMNIYRDPKGMLLVIFPNPRITPRPSRVSHPQQLTLADGNDKEQTKKDRNVKRASGSHTFAAHCPSLAALRRVAKN